jgi:AcrR family transcriptional regulator
LAISSPTLDQPKTRADSGTRRSEILATAAHLFATAGLRVSLQDIAEASGILAGSLYHHFESKDAIVAELIALYHADLDALAGEALRDQDSAEGLPDLERIVQFAESIVRCATRHRAALLQTLYMAPAGADPADEATAAFTPWRIVEAMRAILRAAQTSGYLRAGIDLSRLAAQLCESMFNFAVGTMHLKPEAADIPRTKCRMLLEGLAVEAPGNAQLDQSPAFRIAQNVIASWEAPADDSQLAALKQAARREFSRRSFEAATVRDIASAAGMSTSALYRLVGSKDKLLEAIMTPFIKAVSESWDLLIASPSSTVEKLDALIWVNINLIDRFNEEFKVQLAWLREAPPQPWADFSGFAKRLAQLKELLEAGEREGAFRSFGPSLDLRAHCLLELSWIPRTIMQAHGRPAALAQARETLLRGAAVR